MIVTVQNNRCGVAEILVRWNAAIDRRRSRCRCFHALIAVNLVLTESGIEHRSGLLVRPALYLLSGEPGALHLGYLILITSHYFTLAKYSSGVSLGNLGATAPIVDRTHLM